MTLPLIGSEPGGLLGRRGYSESSDGGVGLTMTSPSRRPNEVMIPENNSQNALNEDVSIDRHPIIYYILSDIDTLFI